MFKMKKYDAILFDFDGVIADTEPLHFDCYRRLLRPFGIDLDWSYYQTHCVGVSDAEMLESLGRMADPPVSLEELWRVYPEKKQLFIQRAAASPPISEDTKRYLKSLTGYRLAVVSSSDRAEIEPMLEAAGILGDFAATVCGNDVLNLKPAPDAYLEAARRLEAKRPLVLEDSAAGVASARAAGFEVLVIENASQMPQNLAAHLQGSGSVADNC